MGARVPAEVAKGIALEPQMGLSGNHAAKLKVNPLGQKPTWIASIFARHGVELHSQGRQCWQLGKWRHWPTNGALLGFSG